MDSSPLSGNYSTGCITCVCPYCREIFPRSMSKRVAILWKYQLVKTGLICIHCQCGTILFYTYSKILASARIYALNIEIYVRTNINLTNKRNKTNITLLNINVNTNCISLCLYAERYALGIYILPNRKQICFLFVLYKRILYYTYTYSLYLINHSSYTKQYISNRHSKNISNISIFSE